MSFIMLLYGFGNYFCTTVTSTLLETGVGTNDCKYSRDQQLNVPPENGGVRDNKF
jgi:hypothetical protein